MQVFHHILLDIYKYLMMQSSISQMVRTRTSKDLILDIPEGSIEHGRGQVPCGGASTPPPHPPISLEQLVATQNDLMRRLVENDKHRGAERQQPWHLERDSSYLDFLATHLLVFALSKGTIVYSTTWGSSTLLLSTGHTTSTQMRRRPTYTDGLGRELGQGPCGHCGLGLSWGLCE
jgi:hypothetical protein